MLKRSQHTLLSVLARSRKRFVSTTFKWQTTFTAFIYFQFTGLDFFLFDPLPTAPRASFLPVPSTAALSPCFAVGIRTAYTHRRNQLVAGPLNPYILSILHTELKEKWIYLLLQKPYRHKATILRNTGQLDGWGNNRYFQLRQLWRTTLGPSSRLHWTSKSTCKSPASSSSSVYCA